MPAFQYFSYQFPNTHKLFPQERRHLWGSLYHLTLYEFSIIDRFSVVFISYPQAVNLVIIKLQLFSGFYKQTWWVRVASKTLSGVTQLKIGDICLHVWKYVCHFVLWPSRILVFAPCLTQSQTSLSRTLRFSDHYPCHPWNWIVYRFEFFCGCN